MNKSELIDAVAQKTGQTKGDTGKTLDALIDVIIEAVVAGDKIQLVGFGTFEPQHPYFHQVQWSPSTIK